MTDSVDPTELINQFSMAFDTETLERHELGQQKYGAFSFLEKDMLQEAIYEVLDMANYARYQYIKLRMLQLYLANDPSLAKFVDDQGEIVIGTDSFKRSQT